MQTRMLRFQSKICVELHEQVGMYVFIHEDYVEDVPYSFGRKPGSFTCLTKINTKKQSLHDMKKKSIKNIHICFNNLAHRHQPFDQEHQV